MVARDVPFEAALLRGALLTGLVQEAEVGAWATERLAIGDGFTSELTEVVLAPEELTAQREALRPLAARSSVSDVVIAVRQWALRDLRDEKLSIRGSLRVLSDLRRNEMFPPDVALAVKEIEDDASMADVGMAGVIAPTFADLIAAVRTGLPEAYYLLTFAAKDECAAFIAAMSRKMDRDRRLREAPGRLWQTTHAEASVPVVVLDVAAWYVAAREFHPLPVAARIPYQVHANDLALLVDAETAVPLGADRASDALRQVRGRS
ncbi:MAG: hypothetical protein ACREN6_14760 [Gemmatimonadaceae bacterium]